MYRAGGIALLLCLLVTEVTAEPYPLDYWARRSAVTGVKSNPIGYGYDVFGRTFFLNASYNFDLGF